MISIEVFLLCCPGKHRVTFANKPFYVLSVQLYQDDNPIPTQFSELLYKPDFVTLTFDKHYNGGKGENIGDRDFTFATLCPILAIGNSGELLISSHLSSASAHKAKLYQPLCSHYCTASKQVLPPS